jgi:hypothetical protein
MGLIMRTWSRFPECFAVGPSTSPAGWRAANPTLGDTHVPFLFVVPVDTMTIAARVVEEARRHKIDAIFVDGGAKAERATQSQDGAVVYANKRAEMWGNMREWLAGGMIENNPDLLSDPHRG